MNVLRPIHGKARVGELQKALSFMPQRKIKHSMRVGATAAKSGLKPDEIEAAILHDYLERGGDPALLAKLNVSARAQRIIKMLSMDEKNSGADDTADVQHHVEQFINNNNIPEREKNVAIIIKCADRIDNLKKRINKDKLSNNYFRASMKLFDTLLLGYTGKSDILAHVKKKIRKISDAVTAMRR